MKKHLISNNSDKLLIFFTGWGCDEYEFEHLKSERDVLLLYDYTDLILDFDFSMYKNYDLIAFSAGVFISSVVEFGFNIEKKIALSGNPYLFDEKLGLSKKIQDILYNITEENADDFAKKYLIKTEEEWKRFRHSGRSLDSCKAEFNSLKDLYTKNKANIKDIFDFALIGENDEIFNLEAQKEFYGKRLIRIENARHSLFFKLAKYEQIFDLIRSSEKNISFKK